MKQKLSEKIQRAIDHTYTVDKDIKNEWLADAVELEKGPSAAVVAMLRLWLEYYPECPHSEGTEDNPAEDCCFTCDTRRVLAGVEVQPPAAIAGVVAQTIEHMESTLSDDTPSRRMVASALDVRQWISWLRAALEQGDKPPRTECHSCAYWHPEMDGGPCVATECKHDQPAPEPEGGELLRELEAERTMRQALQEQLSGELPKLNPGDSDVWSIEPGFLPPDGWMVLDDERGTRWAIPTKSSIAKLHKAQAKLKALPRRSAEVAEVERELRGWTQKTLKLYEFQNADLKAMIRHRGKELERLADKLAGSAPPVPEITPETAAQLRQESDECSEAMAAKVDKMRRGSAPAEPSPDAAEYERLLAENRKLTSDWRDECKKTNRLSDKVGALETELELLRAGNAEPSPDDCKKTCKTVAKLRLDCKTLVEANTRHFNAARAAGEELERLRKAQKPSPDAGELANRLKKKFRVIRSKIKSRQIQVALDTIDFGAEALCEEVRRLQPEPAKAPVHVWIYKNALAIYLRAMREKFPNWDGLSLYAAAPDSNPDDYVCIQVLGAAEGECDGCADHEADIVRLIDEKCELLLERDAARAKLEEQRAIACKYKDLSEAYGNEISNALKRLTAERQAHEETRRAERSVSDAYLRIREIVGAWNTKPGGVDRFEVTEAAVRGLKERVAELEEHHDAACRIGDHAHSEAAEAALINQRLATRIDDLCKDRETLRKRVAELEAGPPEPPRPHGQEGQVMTVRGPQPDADRDGAPTLGITAPHGRVKGPEPDAGRTRKGKVMPPHPRPKK